MVTQTVQMTQKSAAFTSRIFNEGDFKLIITRERKRSERSGRQLLLVSIDFNGTGMHLEDDLMLRQAAENAISSAVREIDFIGWLSFGREIGVLCTEITSSSCHECVSERLLNKLSEMRQQGLVGNVSINCFKFPLELQNGIIKGISELDSELFFPALDSGRQRINKVDTIAKRTIDIVGSLSVLLIVSPFLILIAILIKTTSRGPVFFKQERLGRNGKLFKIYKFRTMKADNNPSAHREFVRSLINAQSKLPSGQPAKIVNDPRITSVGKFLRQTSLDELPQFFNVLAGDMSIVGPRPPIGYEVEMYRPWHINRIFNCKPGITGPWQIQGRSRSSFDDMVRMDIKYQKNWTLWLDIILMLKTPSVMVSKKGAY